MHQRDKILELRAQGMSYNQIQDQTGASKGTISFHLGKGQKEKYKKRNQKNKGKHPYIRKYYQFIDKSRSGRNKDVERYDYGNWVVEAGFAWQDILDKFTDSPLCYLCGNHIDIHRTATYAFDHIIPFSKGGSCKLENLGIACWFCNQSKSNLNPQEYYSHCKKVLENQGYVITEIVGSPGNDPVRNLS
jgi:5-methylcytosine-specific restriction endonuclease McrA